jgi:cyanophycinase
MIPKGRLVIIGGSEEKEGHTPPIASQNSKHKKFEILKDLLQDGSNGHIEIITTASEVPGEIRKEYLKTFKKIGYSHIGFLNIKEKHEANAKKYLDRIKASDAVLFSGGDQFRISTILGGTSAHELLKEKYTHNKTFTIAGTSAGAMAIAKTMIIEGGTNEALLNTDVKTSSGLGFLNNCIVDTHFIKRGRFGRLAHSVIINPGLLGIGLGEDTAMVIKHGTDAECMGTGMVVIIDGQEINQTNIAETDEGIPVYVENLKVHLLVKNCRFSLHERAMHKPAIAPNKSKK